jgi:hypothetical protein
MRATEKSSKTPETPGNLWKILSKMFPFNRERLADLNQCQLQIGGAPHASASLAPSPFAPRVSYIGKRKQPVLRGKGSIVFPAIRQFGNTAD